MDFNSIHKIKTDIHMHSDFSHDSQSKMSQMCQSAFEKGINVICFTDHCDIGYHDISALTKTVSGSVTSSRKENDRFKDKLEVLAGIEIGEMIQNFKQSEEILNLFRFDSVIGSVHAVRFNGYTQPYSTIDFSKMSSTKLKQYLEQYFDDVIETAETADYDILAHITCPLRYINGKYSLNIDAHQFKDKIDEILKIIIKRNKALEINTSGIGNENYNEFLPEEWIVKRYKELGADMITMGSDAHSPEKIANGFPQLYTMLEKAHFDHAYYFKDRKPIKYDLK